MTERRETYAAMVVRSTSEIELATLPRDALADNAVRIAVAAYQFGIAHEGAYRRLVLRAVLSERLPDQANASTRAEIEVEYLGRGNEIGRGIEIAELEAQLGGRQHARNRVLADGGQGGRPLK